MAEKIARATLVTAVLYTVGLLLGLALGAALGVIILFFCLRLFVGDYGLGEAFLSITIYPAAAVLGAAAGAALAVGILRYLRRVGGHPMRVRVWPVAALIGMIAVAAYGMDCYAVAPARAASDEQMLKNFEAHAAVFERLIAMTEENPQLKRMDENWTDPADPQRIGVSRERIAEYRRLLREAGVPRGYQAWTAKEVDFLYWLIGSAVSSDTTKGYAYVRVPPPELKQNLDGDVGKGREVIKAYRHIRGHWYLFFEYLPG